MTQGEPIGERVTDHEALMLGLARIFTLGRLAGWYVQLSSSSSHVIVLELRHRPEDDENGEAPMPQVHGSFLTGYRPRP